jgi:broad specificity phosphatase PhoE
MVLSPDHLLRGRIMKELYFIRHAESEANSMRILASRLPFRLTDAGREDSKRIAGELKELIPRLDRIISSPLLRARETAEAFMEVFQIPLDTDERLSEQNLGPFSGMSYDEVKNDRGYEMETLARWNWIPGGDGGDGESYAMVARRVEEFLESVHSSEVPGETQRILVVTHAVVFRLLRAVLEKTLPAYPKEFPNNGEIWKVLYRGPGFRYTIESIRLGHSERFVHNP